MNLCQRPLNHTCDLDVGVCVCARIACVYVYVCMYVYVCKCVYACECVCVCVCVELRDISSQPDACGGSPPQPVCF